MQTSSVALNIGADVGKDEVAMACAEGSFATHKMRNQRAVLLAFLKDLAVGSRIGMESTGIYHEPLAELAHKRGFMVYDALFAYLRFAAQERHNWPAKVA
jgi:transposase